MIDWFEPKHPSNVPFYPFKVRLAQWSEREHPRCQCIVMLPILNVTQINSIICEISPHYLIHAVCSATPSMPTSAPGKKKPTYHVLLRPTWGAAPCCARVDQSEHWRVSDWLRATRLVSSRPKLSIKPTRGRALTNACASQPPACE